MGKLIVTVLIHEGLSSGRSDAGVKRRGSEDVPRCAECGGLYAPSTRQIKDYVGAEQSVSIFSGR